MSLTYQTFTKAFLAKVTEYNLLSIKEANRTGIVDGYMKRALSGFNHICKYDLVGTQDDLIREFDVDIPDNEIDELVEIVSEGMVVQWLKPYVYNQEILENTLNTRDFTTYSPAELLLRIGNTYRQAYKDYTQMVREYSYNHGELSDLHI